MVIIQVGIFNQSRGIWFPQNLNIQDPRKISRLEFVTRNLRNVPAELVDYLFETLVFAA